MRTNRLPRRVLAAVAAGFLLTAAAPAHADPAPPPSPAPQAPGAHGLRAFQQSYGLPPTGRVDTATAQLLRTAPDSELRVFFAAPVDLGPEQLAHARTVIGVGKGAELSEEAQVIALMTAMQESKFVNYTSPVDHDSLGVFQQRPSMGWGTPAADHPRADRVQVLLRAALAQRQPGAAPDRRLGVDATRRRVPGGPAVRAPGPVRAVGGLRPGPAGTGGPGRRPDPVIP